MLLVGLALNSLLRWSWADPVAALAIAAVAVREGVQAWRGDVCCTPVPGATSQGAADDGCGPGCAGACCAPAGSGATGR